MLNFIPEHTHKPTSRTVPLTVSPKSWSGIQTPKGLDESPQPPGNIQDPLEAAAADPGQPYDEAVLEGCTLGFRVRGSG